MLNRQAPFASLNCDHGRAQGDPIRCVTNGGALILADREKGLLLCSVSSYLAEHLGGCIETGEERAVSRLRA